MKKISYPTFDFINPGKTYDVEKWVKCFEDLQYYKQQNKNAFHFLTESWSDNEKEHFLNWIKFYQEGVHLKYKKAQKYYTNGDYMLPIDLPFYKQPDQTIDESHANDHIKNDQLMKLRTKILARLKAAEKLLEHEYAPDLIGQEYENVIDALHNVRKTIAKIKKASTSGKIYEDMIVREGNKLSRDGFSVGANYLYKIAQMVGKGPDTGEATNFLPNLTPNLTDTTNTGDAFGGDSSAPPQAAPESSPPVDNDSGIESFIKKLNGDNFESDTFDSDDDEEEEEEEDEKDEIVIYDEGQEESELTSFAQQLPEGNALNSAQAPVTTAPIDKPQADIEVGEDASTGQVGEINANEFDSLLDGALGNVKLQDVINKLEQISKIFKTREIPRQLSLVDLMLNKLDLSTYFPELSEATNKSLESNNYVATRIDAILSRLYSSLKIKNLDLSQDNSTKISNPEVDALKSGLEKDEQNEKLKYEMKKQKENDSINKQEAPEIEVEEAAVPAASTQTPVTPAAPVAPNLPTEVK
jgi:hypothetical protein